MSHCACDFFPKNLERLNEFYQGLHHRLTAKALGPRLEDYVINRAKYISLVNIHFDVFEPAVGNQDNTIKLRGEVQRCDLISITKGTKSDIFHL